MLQSVGIRHKLYIGFAANIVIVLALFLFTYNHFKELGDARALERHSREVIISTSKIETALLQVQNTTRGFMLTGNEGILTGNEAEQKKAREALAATMKMVSDNATQLSRLRAIEPKMEMWLTQVIDNLIVKRRELNKTVGVSQQVATSADVMNGMQTINEIRSILRAINDEEYRLLDARRAEGQALYGQMQTLLIAGAALTLVMGVLIAYHLTQSVLRPLNKLTEAVNRIAAGEGSARAEVISKDEVGQVAVQFNRMADAVQDSRAKELASSYELRAKVDNLLDVVSKAARGDLTGAVGLTGEDSIGRLGAGLQTMVNNLRALITEVQKAGIQVTTAATEIAASSKQQEATGIEQAQTSVEVLSTTKEISANTRQLLQTMEEANAVADYTTKATSGAQENLKRMDGTMNHMVNATESINAKLATLSEKASNINSVLTTITKVADQTNILSLNAAIEAEKAGEAGRGFSVVASEIRRLADQTSVSTWDIEQMLKEMQSAVSASVMGMDKFSEEIRRSVDEVRLVSSQLSSIMDGVTKLAPQFDLVLQGMQSQAIGASQISDTMNQLNDATQQTVESLRATSEAVHQLQFAASGLQASVANFVLNGA